MTHDDWPQGDDLPVWEREEEPQGTFEDSEYGGQHQYEEPPPPPDEADEQEKVRRVDVPQTLRRTLAACHGQSGAELAELVKQINAATPVLERMEEDARLTWRSVLELLLDTATATRGASVDLSDLPLKSLYDVHVRRELDKINAIAQAGENLPSDPSLEFFALREAVQRERAKGAAIRYAKAIDSKSDVGELVKKFSSIEPPTTRKAAVRERAAKSVAQLASEHYRAHSGLQKLRLSSGYRTLDIAFTADGEPIGFIAPGEGFVVAGPTGTGKSSWTYGVVPSMAQDLINWGKRHAKIMFLHTEEESIDKARAMMVLPGQPLAHLAENMIMVNVGTSRKLVAMAIYDVVLDAAIQSRETGLPITEFLPYALVLDYIQSISEQGETEVVSTATTAEFLLRGVQAWNPEEMAKFSGISYREYTGSPWPEAMDHHRVAGIYMAQLVKQDDKSLLFRPGARDCSIADFALEDTDATPTWKDSTGSGWSWEVKEGDLRLFKQNAIRGSGVILQNATAIIVLHRSRAYNNPRQAGLGADGRPHLVDTRARLLLDKTRTGSKLKFIPMSFDLDPDGMRARYIDVAAEEAMARGMFEAEEIFARSGDPILPKRPVVSPLTRVRY